MQRKEYNLHAVDQKLAMFMGLKLLAVMIIVLVASSTLFSRQEKEYNDRLSVAIAVTISESINRVSFSGKFHTRKLVSELTSVVAELTYISVENLDNRIFAHSDHSRNDTLIDPVARQENQKCLALNSPYVSEKIIDGLTINEVVIPYRGGIDNEILGTVRIGIDFTGLRESQAKNFETMLLLIAILAGISILIAYKLSRYFGKSVRYLANLLEGIIDHAPMGLIISRKDGSIALTSKETEVFFAKLASINNIAELNSSFLEIAQPEQLAEQLNDLENKAFGGNSFIEKEIEIKTSTGASKFLQIGKFPISRNEQGQNTLVCSFIRDFTEKHAAADRLKESEETFRRLFENSSDAIALMKDGRFVECNHTALSLTGMESKSQLLGLTPADISPPTQEDGLSSAEKINKHIEQALEQGYGRFEWLFKKPDNSTFCVDLALMPIVIRGSRMVHMTWRDITLSKKAAAEKERLQEQLVQAQKMDAVGQLAGGVAHDFNNILSGIMGATELLKEFDNSPMDQKTFLNLILKSTQKAADLTRKLLTFARKSGKESRPVDIARVIAESIEIFNRTLNKNISISFENLAKSCVVIGDETLLQNVFLNLGINSSHAMPDGGKLSFQVRNVVLDADYCRMNPFELIPGNFVEVEVRDTGCGMTPEIQKRIFEPFFTTKESGKGTGLGLAIAYGAIKDHCGAINVYSEVGVGTVFHVYLPLSSKNNFDDKSEQTTIIHGSGRILLVDDEEFLRSIGQTILESLGYQVTLASDGVEAIEIVAGNPEFDLIILDMIMPRMGGKETLIKLKKMQPNCRVIVSSGFAKENDLSEMEHFDICGFLRKPFRMAEFSQAVAEAMHKSSVDSIRK